MKIIILCSLLVSATAYHGAPFIEHTTVELVPNIKQIGQAPSGSHQKPENDIGVNLQSTTSSDFSSSQDDIGQKELSSDIDEEILQLIFGPDNDTGVESSTTQFSEADLKVLNCSESTQQNKENSGVGQIDVRSSNKMLCFQNISEHGQYGQGFKPGTQSPTEGPTKNQFGTSSNISNGLKDNSNIGYNSVGFSSTTNLIPSGQKTGEVSSTPSSKAGTSQSNRPENQGGQNMSVTYPVFRPVNQDGNSQPRVNPTYPNTRPGYQGGNSQPGINPTYSITRSGYQGGGSQPGITQNTRSGNQGGSTWTVLNPTYPTTRPGYHGGSTWPGLSPTYAITRSGNQGGSTQPGLNPTHSITRPSNNGGNIQPGVNPTYPIFQSGNQAPIYWPNIAINPTEAPISQGGVIPGYWPYVQYSGYYSPNFVPGQGGFSQHGWVGNSQGYFYGYPPNGYQYGWPYTQNQPTYGNGWFGFGGQEARPYSYNHNGINGQERQHSHHHHHHKQPGGEHHGYH